MVLLHDSVFDKYRGDGKSTRKQKQIKTGAEPGQEERKTQKHETSDHIKLNYNSLCMILRVHRKY
jgi:hypothetical protein